MLPKMPNQIRHNKRDVIAFGGLNLTHATNEGEFADSKCITTSGYPWLQTAADMAGGEGEFVTYADEVFVWDGDVYTVQGTKLYKNDTEIGDVTSGLKQMAVVNTKLVIYPDKVYVDMTDDTMHSLIKESHYWTTNTVTHNSVTANGIGNYFAAGDVVDVTGTGMEGKRIVVLTSETNTLTFADNSITLDNPSGRVTVESSVPELDFICSSGNRLWGLCNEDRTIYVSSLGDPTSFFDYTGEGGSWSVAVGSEGDFTGICAFGGSVLAWKENLLHKILGSYPSEYYTVDYPIYGVQKGSDKSLVVINNVLYYKGTYGVYQYGGNRPINISDKLGNGIYTNAVASGDADNYYIGMADPAGEYHLYVYDIKRGLWIKRYDRRMVSSAASNMTAYFISADQFGNNVLFTVSENDRADRNTEWLAEMTEVTESTFNRKGYTKLLVRLDMADYSELKIYAKEDRRAYRKIWEMDNPKHITLLPSHEVAETHELITVAIDKLPSAGDEVVFTCTGFDDASTVWRNRTYPADGNLETWALFAEGSPEPLMVEAVCYINPESEKYKTIEFSVISLEGETISVWMPDGEHNPVTQLVPIRLGRCDRWQMKFEGKGDVTIRAIERNFVTGSEK